MTTTAMGEINQLSVSERIQPAEHIWDTIVFAPDELALPDSQRAELDRRIQAYRSAPHSGDSRQVVQQRIGAQ